jgi:hypothetical protein
VRHIALPAPGDWRQFCIQASRIHARALDLSRPLWEIYVIEGLDSVTDLPAGSFALLTKIHHAAVAVEQHHEIVDVLHDTTRRPPRHEPPEPWFPERPPGALSLILRGAVHQALAPQRLLKPLARMVPAVKAFAEDLRRPESQTATRFNSVVSAHRVFDTRRFTQREFEAICGLVEGATLDDAVLAVCAAGLRRYLGERGELPLADLSAIVPGGQVQLGTCVADAVQRLALIQARATAAEPGAVAARRSLPLATCTVTPVSSPQGPLYLNGARMTYFSAILPIADGMGLVFAVTRYDGLVVVSPTSCRELMPDPQAFTQCVRDSFQEYLALAGAATVAPKAPRAKAAPKARPTEAAPRASSGGRRSPGARTVRKAATGLPAAPGGRPRSTAPRR